MVDSSALNGRALNHNSRTLVGGVSRAGARAMFKATGLNDEDLEKPLIAIANTWTEIGPCNIHLRRLATKVKEGIRAAGGTPLEFNTITINDGITMGTAGMKASLISREMIADSIELVTRANYFDGIVALCSCDKTIPGTIMGLIRLNIPGLVLYGGTILPGELDGEPQDIVSVYEAIGAYSAGKISSERCSRSRTSPARGRAPVAASTPRTRWPTCRRSSACARWASPTSRPLMRRRTRSRARPARSCCGWWPRTCARTRW